MLRQRFFWSLSYGASVLEITPYKEFQVIYIKKCSTVTFSTPYPNSWPVTLEVYSAHQLITNSKNPYNENICLLA